MENGELWIQANGVKHWVRVAGAEHNTIPLIAIHGGPGGHQWILEKTGGKLLEEFATLVYYDQRGCGRSDPPADSEEYSIEVLIDDLEQIREALKVDRFIPIGHSFGGELALEYALKYPQNVEKIILEGPAIGDWERLALNQIMSFISITDGEVQEKLRNLLEQEGPYTGRNGEAWKLADEQTTMAFSFFKKESYAKLVEISTDDAPKVGNEKMKQKIQEVPFSNLIGRIKEIECSVLVMTGLYDGNTGIDMARDIKRNLSNSEIEIFLESGHYIQMEEPEKMAAVVREFMNR
ncbi:proline iminopeptidase [Bacillus sp. AFS015802]|uniref:alpha/beta fold hydrolase n=1 Tax=Bacillus sp. AFS015802 TaxID=2033486 RepID=UPI000BF47F9D|nr:alpha/beta hydrolase [Bacillus sp. AFS015802]PFA66736.1 proline iminopeptidase [Bacillus sp. AFS015802]